MKTASTPATVKGSAKSVLDGFRFAPGGAMSLEDAVCLFVKEEIARGRLKGGGKFPTMKELAAETGLPFHKARGVMERLAREGYVRSRPHVGTVVCPRGGNVLRGRVLVLCPDADICRFYPAQLFDILNRKLTAAGYAVSVSAFPLDAGGSLAQLRNELLRATDLVLAMRATPRVQRCLAEAGVKHVFAYGDKPKAEGAPWIRFSPEEALEQFARHCKRAGVRRVVQVRFEGNETLDAGPALAKAGIGVSWLAISRQKGGRSRFDNIVHCACDKFESMPRGDIPDLLLFWNAFAAQGAMMAFLDRGIRIPEDARVVSLSETGFGPAFVKPVTRFENDPMDAGEKIADFALAVLAKGRVPPPPQIAPHYVFGSTFPF